jgi:hypothetical protein
VTRRANIVPHTHWDREWYEPFPVFRQRLVRLFDTLLDMLEGDPAYTHFLLDGQTQVVDDYLEVRPEARARIAALAASGRISVGPWRILMDEAMVSGETIVRDLQMGLVRASELGGLMEVGYLPDMFCHIAQMPQLLALGGFSDAVLWRGVPRAIATTGFWWEGPDGSAVRVEYLFGSYSNASVIPPSGDALIDLARRFDDEVGAGLVGAMLLMHGTDHQVPVPWLAKVVDDANAAASGYRFSISSLAEHVQAQPRDDTLPRWRGEMRSGARANVLMGTASNHVDVHQRAAAAERALERVAEPLAALLLPPAAYPHATLRMAWDQLVLDSAHDSSCACSHDDTVAAVNVRYADARHIAEAVTDDVLAAFAASIDAPRGALVVVNPTSRTRTGLVELTRPGTGPFHLINDRGDPLPAQLVDERPGDTISTVVQGTKVHWLLTMIRNGVAAGMRTARIDVEEHDGEQHVTFHPAVDREAGIDVEPVLARMQEWGAAGAVQRVTVSGAPQRTMLVETPPIAGLGWDALRVGRGASAAGGDVTVDADDIGMSNGWVRVIVDRHDGTFTMTDVDSRVCVERLGRIVEGGDGGDTYNYSPPPDDVPIDAPLGVRVRVTERGPVRARVEVERDYAWPAHALGDHLTVTARASTTTDVTVLTRLELRAGERFVRVHHQFDNPCRDHRVRVHFPLPRPVAGSDAECAFTVVHRGLTAEGGPQEFGLPTFVSRRFVDCSDGDAGLAVVHDGLLEYEVVDDGRELALTLLRSTGWISRATMAYRSEPCGPFVATPGAQLVGPVHADYAVVVHDGDWLATDLYGVADEVLVPFGVVRASGDEHATRPRRGSALVVEGAEASAVLRDDAGRLVVRLFRADPTAGVASVQVGGRAGRGDVVDLRGRVVGDFAGSIELRANQIVTLRMHDDEPA